MAARVLLHRLHDRLPARDARRRRDRGVGGRGGSRFPGSPARRGLARSDSRRCGRTAVEHRQHLPAQRDHDRGTRRGVSHRVGPRDHAGRRDQLLGESDRQPGVAGRRFDRAGRRGLHQCAGLSRARRQLRFEEADARHRTRARGRRPRRDLSALRRGRDQRRARPRSLRRHDPLHARCIDRDDRRHPAAPQEALHRRSREPRRDTRRARRARICSVGSPARSGASVRSRTSSPPDWWASRSAGASAAVRRWWARSGASCCGRNSTARAAARGC